MIYIKKDGVNKWRVNNYTFSDPQMGIRTISLTVNHPLDWVDGEPVEVPDFTKVYVEYEGEQYFITNSKPTAEKDTSGISFKYTITFKGGESDLESRKVRNLAEAGVDKFISQGTSFSIHADIVQFADLLKNNLNYCFGDKWELTLGVSYSDRVLVTVNDMFIWDLLIKTYELYGLRWFIRGNTIYMGYEPDYIEHVFDYGSDGGLVKITRTAQGDRVANRLTGVGSSRNVPMNYFTNRYPDFPLDPNPISDVTDIVNTMPKVFRDSVISGNLPYIDYVEDTDLVSTNGVSEDSLGVNDDIFPSISGVEVPGIGRIDEIIHIEDVSADKPGDDGYKDTFDVWLKDIQFDLKDDIYTSTKDAKISFTSGVLSGYEFIILAQGGSRVVVEDTSKTHNGIQSKYRITLIKSSEEYEASGRMIPNSAVNASPNDSFVIYDIEMPQSYVELAERRVQEWLESKLDELKKEKPTYAIEPMDMFFEDKTPESDGKTIKEKLRSGNKLSINNTKLTEGVQELHINQVTIQYGGILPKYVFIVTDKVSVHGSAVKRLEESISSKWTSLSAESSKWNSASAMSHFHGNKSLLDSITKENIEILKVWKIDEDGNLYTELNVYSMLEVSAYGKGFGGLVIPPFEITDPAAGQALQFNGTHWVNVPWPGGGGGGSTVSWGTTLNGYSPLTVEGLAKTVALSGHAHAASDITSGVFATARLGGGTPSASNFLRGDGTWATPAGATYSAGNGLTLSGTVFSLPVTIVGTGNVVEDVLQNSSGITVYKTTLASTIYSGSTSIILSGTSFQRAALTGDVTSPQNSNALTLANSGVTAGTYNNVATQVRPFTVDAKGRITAIGTAVTIAPAWDNVTGKPSTFAPSVHTHAWGEITSKPTTFTPSAHTHAWGEVTGKPTTLSGYGISTSDTLFDSRYLRLTGGTLTGDLHTPTVQIFGDSNGIRFTRDGSSPYWVWINTENKLGIGNGASAASMMIDNTGNIRMPSLLDVGGEIKSAINITSPKFSLSTGWTFEPSGSEMQFKYNGVLKHRLLSDGSFVAVGEITAYGAASGGASAFLPISGGTMTGILTIDKTGYAPTGEYLTQSHFLLRNSAVTNTAMAMGLQPGGGGWIESIWSSTGGSNTLSLNPRGGNVGIGILLPTVALDVVGEIKSSLNVASPKITLGNGWTIEQTAASLTIKRNGVVKYTINA